MTATPRVSIITPVYNGARYLAETMQSVLEQTFQDWEYIVYDNQSTDATPAIASGFAAKDARVRVIRGDEFVSVLPNHNRSIRAMNPAAVYCKFVHADDWLYPECVARMVEVADAHPSVGVVSSYRLEDRFVEHDGLLPYEQASMKGQDVIRSALRGPPWVTGSQSSLLFRADLLRADDTFFDPTVWHADTDSAYKVLMQSDLGFVHQVLTYTRLHPGALTSFSNRVNTYLSHAGRVLIRYGRAVFTNEEYRARMREWLRQYGWFLTKQLAKRSRHRDSDFHEFHRREIAYMQAELGPDKEFQGGLWVCRQLLRKGDKGSDERDGTGPAPAGISRYSHVAANAKE